MQIYEDFTLSFYLYSNDSALKVKDENSITSCLLMFPFNSLLKDNIKDHSKVVTRVFFAQLKLLQSVV